MHACRKDTKYRCTVLPLPYSLGSAFHWQPVRNT